MHVMFSHLLSAKTMLFHLMILWSNYLTAKLYIYIYIQQLCDFMLTAAGHPEFGTTLPSITVAEGGRAEFNCDVISVPPATVLTWTYESAGIQHNLTSGGRITISPPTSLIISNVQPSDDGYYICTAENSFGRNSTSGRLTVGSKANKYD